MNILWGGHNSTHSRVLGTMTIARCRPHLVGGGTNEGLSEGLRGPRYNYHFASCGCNWGDWDGYQVHPEGPRPGPEPSLDDIRMSLAGGQMRGSLGFVIGRWSEWASSRK